MIRGIDNQIMINKSLDYARHMSDQNNNVQQGKDFIAEMEKVRIKHEGESVVHVQDEDTPLVRREKEQKNQKEGHALFEQEEREELEDDIETVEGKKENGLGMSIDINV